MRRLRPTVMLLLWSAVVALVAYELAAKAPDTALGPMPGSDVAARAELLTPYRAATGIEPLDLLLHESREACVYYRGLATGRVDAPRDR